jgi:hypothetical protein
LYARIFIESQTRELDSFFSLEENLLTRGAQDRESVLAMIRTHYFVPVQRDEQFSASCFHYSRTLRCMRH